MILNRENNQKDIQLKIAKKGYTHVFTTSKIAISKKFKKNILDSSQFTDCLYLLTIDKIYLVKEWDKGFSPLYAKIEKV